MMLDSEKQCSFCILFFFPSLLGPESPYPVIHMEHLAGHKIVHPHQELLLFLCLHLLAALLEIHATCLNGQKGIIEL